MLIICPSCATSYDVELASLEPDGRQVRCVRCRTIWRAQPNRAEQLVAAAQALSPGAPAAHIPADEPVPDPADLSDEVMAEAQWADRPADGQSVEALADRLAAASEAAEIADPADEPNDPVEVEAPPIVPAAPVDLDEGRPPIVIAADDLDAPADAPPEDIETFAARHVRQSLKRRDWRWSLSRLQSGILALLIVDAVLVGWRNDVVRVLPQTASFYALLGLPVNVRGLTFEKMATITEQQEGVPILMVEGNIVNDTRRTVEVPRIKLAVRNAARQEVYSWTAVPTRATLSPGEAIAFRSRLASPPPDAHDVLVRFVNRRDIVAGLH